MRIVAASSLLSAMQYVGVRVLLQLDPLAFLAFFSLKANIVYQVLFCCLFYVYSIGGCPLIVVFLFKKPS